MPKYEDYVLQDPVTPPVTPAADPAPVVPAPPAEPSAVEQLNTLRQERDELKNRLSALSAGTKAQQTKLVELEAAVRTLSTPKAPEQPPAPDPRDVMEAFDNKIAEVEEALAAAEATDPAKAPALRRELRGLERRYNGYVTEQRMAMFQPPDATAIADMSAKQARQTMEYEAARMKVLADYPMLDGDGDVPNTEMIEAVYDLYHPMIRGGVEPSKALTKAVRLVAKDFDIKPASAAQAKLADVSAPRAIEEKSKTVQRKQEAVARNLEAKDATPPDIGGAGKSNDAGGVLNKYNFADMSIDEFMRIPDGDQERIEEALRRYEG